ncbi:MAG: arylsulfatase, partial [Roseibacillus sp.]|nr:arylsulfatase [Roseibacillus sp.]
MSIPTQPAYRRHLFFLLLWIALPSATAYALPNIVILYADDMGVGDVSFGDRRAKIQTPNIDRLASRGMTFLDGHSSSGICTPSRFALLTGQHHWRRFHGI